MAIIKQIYTLLQASLETLKNLSDCAG